MIENVNFLLFCAHNLLFGVYAEQVEELLEGGVLSEQEEASVEYTIPYKGQDIRVINFSRWIEKEQGMGDGEHLEPRTLSFVPEHRDHDDIFISSPKILIIKRQDGGYIGVRIADLENLATVPIKQIHSLPAIMQKTKRIQGLWGIALVENRPAVLIDLTQL